MRGEVGGLDKGERKTGDSQASSKRPDSATGSPLTLSGDNKWVTICAFDFLKKRDP